MLVKIVNPTSNVYIIVFCQENTLNDTDTTLNWIPGTDNLGTYQTPARFPFFFILVPGTHFYRKQTKYTTLTANLVCTTTVECP